MRFLVIENFSDRFKNKKPENPLDKLKTGAGPKKIVLAKFKPMNDFKFMRSMSK